MPGNIVNLDELVPEDITFKYRGEEYRIPGDPPTDAVFDFLRLYDDLLQARLKAAEAATTTDPKKQGAALSGTRDEMEKLLGSIRERLLGLFQVCQPEMTALPFGNNGTMEVLGYVLQVLGIAVKQDPPTPAPKPKPARKPARRKS